MRYRPWVLGLVALLGTSACSRGDDSADGLFHWKISTAVEIDAPAARVWSVLVDLPAYREWNPFIVEASGTVAVGETLALQMALPGRSPMTIKPRLLVVDPDRRLEGASAIPGERHQSAASALTYRGPGHRNVTAVCRDRRAVHGTRRDLPAIVVHAHRRGPPAVGQSRHIDVADIVARAIAIGRDDTLRGHRR